MRRDVCHYFERDVESVYNAYIKATKEKFGKDCSEYPHYKISFGINMSFKYNMNGGACTVHFMPCKSGVAVCIRYTIVQAFGARYKAHDADYTEYIEGILGIKSQRADIDMDEFLRFEKRLNSPNEAKSQNVTVVQISEADELKKYKELLDSGVITQAEFEAKKKQILGL